MIYGQEAVGSDPGNVSSRGKPKRHGTFLRKLMGSIKEFLHELR